MRLHSLLIKNFDLSENMEDGLLVLVWKHQSLSRFLNRLYHFFYSQDCSNSNQILNYEMDWHLMCLLDVIYKYYLIMEHSSLLPIFSLNLLPLKNWEINFEKTLKKKCHPPRYCWEIKELTNILKLSADSLHLHLPLAIFHWFPFLVYTLQYFWKVFAF